MFDIVRTSLHKVITSPVGDSLLPVRFPKDVARRLNRMAGEPLCSPDELERRKAATAKLASLRAGTSHASPVAERAVAPVVVYFEKDRNVRMLERIRETLSARSIQFSMLDVTDDEVTKDFVMREARCKEDELPIVFIAATPVGGFSELVAWDAAGKLTAAVFPKG